MIFTFILLSIWEIGFGFRMTAILSSFQKWKPQKDTQSPISLNVNFRLFSLESTTLGTPCIIQLKKYDSDVLCALWFVLTSHPSCRIVWVWSFRNGHCTRDTLYKLTCSYSALEARFWKEVAESLGLNANENALRNFCDNLIFYLFCRRRAQL